ncbi:MAG: DUF6383 domain-containing protein [Parabacteroides sp.]|nr:DUF6383 domain-containing protein [Parabacteroides sp.]
MANQPNIRLSSFPITYNVTAGNGIITTGSGDDEAHENEDVSVVTTPDPGYRISTVSYTPEGEQAITIDKDDNGKYQFKMPAKAVVINVSFMQEHNIATASINSTIQIEDGKKVAIEGEEVIFTVSASSGYELKEVKVQTTNQSPVQLTEQGNSKYSFTMPAADVVIMASFEKIVDPTPDPDPVPDPAPTVFYTVFLPAIKGAVTDPVAGEYDVESWGSFRFYLTLDEEYNQSVPVVTTNRGETIEPRSSDGAYIIKYVRSDVEIFIDGIVKNPDPVANEAIEVNQSNVWTGEGCLYIKPATDNKVYIYTSEGKLEAVRIFGAGEMQTVRLPAGIYLVRIGNERFKVRL